MKKIKNIIGGTRSEGPYPVISDLQVVEVYTDDILIVKMLRSNSLWKVIIRLQESIREE